jgi:hypothetical protein
MLVAQVSGFRASGNPTRFWSFAVLWIALIVISALAVYLDWRDGGFELPKTQVVKRASAVVTISALIGAGQFWYTSSFIPFEASPTLSVVAELQHFAATSNRMAVRATITVKNTGSAKVVVLGSLYRLTGASQPTRTTPPAVDAEVRNAWAEGHPPASVFTSSSTTHLIQTGRLLPLNWSFDRGEELHTSFVAFVPSGQFDSASLHTEIYVAKSEVLKLDSEASEQPGGYTLNGHRYYGQRQGISEASWVARLTGANGKVYQLWRLDDDGSSPNDQGSPDLYVSIVSENAGRPTGVTSGTLTFYGVAQTITDDQLPLGDLGKTP